jgi:hypothetical protein
MTAIQRRQSLKPVSRSTIAGATGRDALSGLLSRPRLSRSHRFPGTCRFERRREIEEYGVLSVSRRELDPRHTHAATLRGSRQRRWTPGAIVSASFNRHQPLGIDEGGAHAGQLGLRPRPLADPPEWGG